MTNNKKQFIQEKMYLVNQMLQQKNYDTAVVELQKLTIEHPDDVSAHKLLAKIWMKTETLDFAFP